MTFGVAFEALVVISLFALLGAVVVRMGVHRNLLIAMEEYGLGRATTVAILVVSIAGVGTTGLVGSPDFDRFGLTEYEIGLVLFFTGTVLLGMATARGEEYRRLSGVTATTVREATDGDTVALTGAARGTDDDLLQSPVTGTPCIAYDVRLETRVRSLRFPATFYVIDDQRTARRPFSLEDDTGTIEIDASDARIDLPASETSDAPESRLLLARALGGTDSRSETACRRRSERRLDPGTEVGVLGTVVRDDGRRVVDADAVFIDPYYDRNVRRAVRRNGSTGVATFVVGLVVMFLAADVV